MGVRTQAREVVLQMLFQRDFLSKLTPNQQLQLFFDNFEAENDSKDYACHLFEGIDRQLSQIDEKIQAHARNWRLDRMTKVDLNVMRIATFESLYMDPPTPPKVAMDEAITIAKKYGTTDSGSFVNGILDSILADTCSR